jgi:hypothetical protein
LSHKNKITKEKYTNSSKDYIFDLINTLYLNIDLIEKVAENNPNKDLIHSLLAKFKEKFDRKKELKDEISKIKGKLLIEKQIIEELKRKIDENEEYYKDQLKEMDENYANKEEYIKIFEKKLKEVEIYIHKNLKSTDKQYNKFKDFKMNDFIDVNTDLFKRDENLRKDLVGLRDDINRVRRENDLYDVKNTEANISFSKKEEENSQNIRNYVKLYKNQIKVVEMRIRLFRNYYKDMALKFNIKSNNF